MRFAIIPLLLLPSLVIGQKTQRAITFPDIPGYKTLKCDFHIHTVFSDGKVWPNIRVQEAIRDGLDAISLTEHLEYQPHAADLPHPDRNRSYDIAVEQSKAYDLIVVRGSEITRKLPPGHANAIFIQDANKLVLDDSIAAYREAVRQGGFIFWNHPNWISQQRNGIATLTDLHRQLIGEGLLHGIEVVNDITYSDEALQIALDHNLAIIGTSDIHGLVDWQFEIATGGHRPINLIFARERTEASIREALFEGRSAAWFQNLLIGRQDVLEPLVSASISVAKAAYQGPSSVVNVEITNNCDAKYMLKNRGTFTFHNFGDVLTLEPHSTTMVQVKTIEQKAQFELDFEVLNAIIAPKQHVRLRLPVKVDL